MLLTLRTFFVFAFLVLWCGLTVSAQEPTTNWPAWRGPLANGVAPQGDPPTKWSETENIKWKVEIPGVGSSTPII